MGKRKYKKSGKYKKNAGSSSGKTEGLEPSNDSSILSPVAKSRITVTTFEDLPLSIRIQVEKDIAFRKRLNLFDDSEDRKARALRYYKEKYG